MSRRAIAIEDRLHSAGYQTTRSGGEVQVFDPVHQAVAGSKELVLSHHRLVEIRTLEQAWAFIDERR